jgi:iron uptake system component EfeO
MMFRSLRLAPLATFIVLAGAACSSSSNKGAAAATTDSGAPLTDADYQAQVLSGMHDSLLTDINSLLTAAQAIQAAAPATAAGWADANQVTALKNAWIPARTAYEHSEGAIAPLFPDVDISIDARYDDFLAALGPAGDTYLFDDMGVTGMHAMERIMYQPNPQNVITFEATLPGYVASAAPATDQQAADFKNKLAAKLVSDVTALQGRWTPVNLNIAIAYQGLVALMNEQKEKVNKAASSEEESRYSLRTLADLRDNLAGTKAIYGLFEPWVLSKTNASDPTKDGPTIDGKIQAGFTKLNTAYSQITGDAFPPVPATWSSENPSAADLATPFGQLYSQVLAAVDPNTDGTVVYEMNAVATLLGFPISTQ